MAFDEPPAHIRHQGTLVEPRAELPQHRSRYHARLRFAYRSTAVLLLFILLFFSIFGVLLASLGFVITYTLPSIPRLRQEKPVTCGDSPSTARALGCHFDLMSFSWLPPACYDAELSYDFTYAYPNATAPNKWNWYEDLAATRPVPISRVEAGDYEALYVSWEYHLVHCVFMFKKLHRAVEQGLKIDGYIGNMGHTEHCGRTLLGDRTMDPASVNTMIRQKFPTC